MSELFKETLEEASKRVAQWPEWKKSEALKSSERLLESKKNKCTETGHGPDRASSAVAGE